MIPKQIATKSTRTYDIQQYWTKKLYAQQIGDPEVIEGRTEEKKIYRPQVK